MKYDVFISYSTKDKHVADAICSSFENSGIRCWFAPRDIIPGSNWAQGIIDAIKSSRIMVLVFSENSNGSPQVTKELNLAISNNLMVIPFKIDSSTPSGGMEYFLADVHWLDAINDDIHSDIARLKGVIMSVIDSNEAFPGQETAATCPSCGSKMPPGATLCRNCITASNIAPEAKPQAEPQPTPKKATALRAYLELWKNIFNFETALQRKPYWKAILIHCIVFVLACMTMHLTLPYTLVSLIPLTSATVRRLHDANRSGHWMWLSLTVVGLLVILVFSLMPAVDDGNRFKNK